MQLLYLLSDSNETKTVVNLRLPRANQILGTTPSNFPFSKIQCLYPSSDFHETKQYVAYTSYIQPIFHNHPTSNSQSPKILLMQLESCLASQLLRYGTNWFSCIRRKIFLWVVSSILFLHFCALDSRVICCKSWKVNLFHLILCVSVYIPHSNFCLFHTNFGAIVLLSFSYIPIT